MSFPATAELYLISEDGREVGVWPAATALPEGTLQETRQYILELRQIVDPDQIDLHIDDRPVEALRSPNPSTARWRWSPGFYAGEVQVRLTGPGGADLRFNWGVDPDLRKLTRQDFDTMVREILEDTVTLFSLSPARFGVGRGAGKVVPPIARLEYLRSRITEIEAVVRQINSAPVRVLGGTEKWLPYSRVRTVTGEELIRSLRSSRILGGPDSQARLPPSLKGYWPSKIRKQVRTEGLDIREHRNIKASLRSWSSWLSATGELLAASETDDAELRVTQRVWARRC